MTNNEEILFAKMEALEIRIAALEGKKPPKAKTRPEDVDPCIYLDEWDAANQKWVRSLYQPRVPGIIFFS